MRISNKSIVPGILIKSKRDLGYFGNENYPEYRFYFLTEIKRDDGHDILVFYGLTEGKFISVYRWYVEKSILNKLADIVA